jgi:hypothetical protein
MTNKAFISFVRQITKSVHIEDIPSVLRSNGFRRIGEGYFKNVFVSKARKDLVVKVYKDNRGWRYDSYFPLPRHLKKYWLAPLAQNRKYMIQLRIKESSEAADIINEQEDIEMEYDIHEANCGMYNGMPYIFDYCN